MSASGLKQRWKKCPRRIKFYKKGSSTSCWIRRFCFSLVGMSENIDTLKNHDIPFVDTVLILKAPCRVIKA